jgi:hypothetical protein
LQQGIIVRLHSRNLAAQIRGQQLQLDRAGHSSHLCRERGLLAETLPELLALSRRQIEVIFAVVEPVVVLSRAGELRWPPDISVNRRHGIRIDDHHDRVSVLVRGLNRERKDRANPLQPPVRDVMLAAVPSLRAFAISLCGKVDRADDLVQETLLREIHDCRYRRLKQHIGDTGRIVASYETGTVDANLDMKIVIAEQHR